MHQDFKTSLFWREHTNDVLSRTSFLKERLWEIVSSDELSASNGSDHISTQLPYVYDLVTQIEILTSDNPGQKLRLQALRDTINQLIPTPHAIVPQPLRKVRSRRYI